MLYLQFRLFLLNTYFKAHSSFVVSFSCFSALLFCTYGAVDLNCRRIIIGWEGVNFAHELPLCDLSLIVL